MLVVCHDITKKIEQEKQSLVYLDQTIAKGKDLLAQELQRQGMNAVDAQAAAEQQIVSLRAKRVEAETRIIGLQTQQLQNTKALRDGYVNAISAMTAGTGMFAKVMIDQNKNLGVQNNGLRFIK